MFGNLSDKFESALRKVSGKGKISEGNIAEAMEDVREALLEADVDYEIAEAFVGRVSQEAVGTEVLESVDPGQQIIQIVHEELVRLLGGEEAVKDDDPTGGLQAGGPADAIPRVSPGPTVVMVAGLQGSGKTTTCGKLAAALKKQGRSVTLGAADLQRPAAVTQLRVLSEQVGSDACPGTGEVFFHGEPDACAAYGEAVGVAVEVAKRALAAARAHKADVLILDTAGRLHLNDELMKELKRVERAVGPHQVLLVLDAMTGQDAVNSAEAFDKQLEIDGVVLTKFDSDTRGGAALSVREVTGKPIRFVGTGETLDALEGFHPRRIAGRILGMGDVVSLVEKAQAEVSEEEATRLQDKLAAGEMTMEDFLKQLKALRRMGSMKSLLGMLPGVGSQLKNLDLDEGRIDRTEAIINSMSTTERRKVKILDNSRRRRIAKGCGQEPADVSQLVKGFEMVSQMGQLMGGGGTGMMGKMKALSQMGPAAQRAALAGGGGVGKTRGSTKMPSPKYKKRKKR
ncbi:signal recognition particle protein [Phycisphaera mikurensis]|uniref:Signal recognition particle protein n=1 Tax=Phycisphaera mikurensis (strain NBRC 102666 / KCTC 22515 / FYK2301M01) TaxID=1142394 RepID=I0IIZ7_PHYMF|nr:signal recognition particle protein [Phycisphaera mikurensis]MBB6443082.1 signal recognition particle subunit SRP54 [Phycisphaera mikurensis]BAM05235.1 signal recognition particle protein [Phycisphaera mikurensis NBRC 102666]